MTPEPLDVLDVDPRVAVVAYRFPSRSAPGRTYDAALLIGEDCGEPATFWDCTCWPFLKIDWCQHVVAAERLLRLEEAREARQAWLNEQIGCRHPLVVNEGSERVCFACGSRYSKAAYDVQCLRLRDAIRERHRLPTSPWSAAERSVDTE
jgi:hypothetical protein